MMAKTTKKKKENRGGVRPGSGVKPQGPNGEVKKKVTVKLYPSQIDAIKLIHGSTQQWADDSAPKIPGGTTK